MTIDTSRHYSLKDIFSDYILHSNPHKLFNIMNLYESRIGAGPRLPDFAILGVRVMQPGARAAVALGIVDTGAGFSAIMPSAAQLLKAQAGQQAVTGYNIL